MFVLCESARYCGFKINRKMLSADDMVDLLPQVNTNPGREVKQ
jgi:hypothetical protein